MSAFQRPAFCDYNCSKYYIPNLTASHAAIELVKADVQKRRSTGSALKSRPVTIVYRPAKDKSETKDRILTKISEFFQERPLWAYHWAIKVDDQYFELELRPVAKWRSRPWPKEVKEQVIHQDLIGETYMTDVQILAIGNHYLECWHQEYNLAFSNCQSVAFAVLGDIVVNGKDVHKLRSGYKVVSKFTASLRKTMRRYLLREYESSVVETYEDAFVEYVLYCNDICNSNEFAGLQSFQNKLITRPALTTHIVIAALTDRLAHDTYVMHALVQNFPVLVNSEGKPSIVKMQEQHPKWTNRSVLPLLPLALGSTYTNMVFDITYSITTNPKLHCRTLLNLDAIKSMYWPWSHDLMDLGGLRAPTYYHMITGRKYWVGVDDSEEAKQNRLVAMECFKDFWNGCGTAYDNHQKLRDYLKTTSTGQRLEQAAAQTVDEMDGSEAASYGEGVPKFLRKFSGRIIFKLLVVCAIVLLG